MADIVIVVVVCLLMAAMAYLGVHLTLHSAKTKQKKLFWTCVFIMLALLSCVFVALQKYRDVRAQEGLQSKIMNMPRPPTAEQNAAAVIALEEKRSKEQKEQAPATPVPGTTHPKQPKPPLRSTPQTIVPPSQLTSGGIGKLIVTQSPDISTRDDAPYLTRVVIQSTVEFSHLKLALECDGPIVDGHGGVNGAMIMMGEGVANGYPNVFVLTYQSASPAFGPSSPITLSLWSKNPIHCSRVTTF